MKRIILCLFVTALLVGPALAQCGPRGCPNGQCPVHSPASSLQSPAPVWRYVKPVGFHRAVVRVHCWDGGNSWSKGSGVLVRWGKRAVVLTARHVIKNARRILIDFPGGRRSRTVKVLKVDRTWDCAVLKVGDIPDEIEPAEMAFGADAHFRDGDRLETCGYGPDGKLAGNRGLFRGYRRSTAAPEGGPDDWMVVSGRARGGDSGGPVFDRKGRVVGILWGTDGREVICVQPGRIHEMLNSIPFEEQASTERRPTPSAIGPLEAVGSIPLLPWRKESEAKDKTQDELINRLIALEERQAAVGANVSPNIHLPDSPTPRNPDTPNSRSPLLGGLCLFAGIVGGFVIYFANQKGE